MGFIRGSLFVIASIFLFILFLIGNVFLTLSLSLDYENVQPELFSVMKDVLEEELVSENLFEQFLPTMELYCENNTEFDFGELSSKEIFKMPNIPCEVVYQGSDAIFEYNINSQVENIYYNDYSCEFWNCLEETKSPFFLISKKAQDYWKSRFYILLIMSLGLIIFMFFLAENKSSLFFTSGILLIFSALPFSKLDVFINSIIGPLFSTFGIIEEGLSVNLFIDIFSIFFTQSKNVFLKVLILGILFFIIGILLKFLKIGFKISNFISKIRNKESQKLIKKNISKPIKKPSK